MKTKIKTINIEVRSLENCHDCGVKPGQAHLRGCDVEHCSVCGYSRLGCSCKDHDPLFARWTGIWPGYAESRALGITSLDKFLEHRKAFFIKPKAA
jgi:hypothetical protein